MHSLVRLASRRTLRARPTLFSAKPIAARFFINGPGAGPQLPGQPDEEAESNDKKGAHEGPKDGWGPTIFKMFESAMTTLASVAVLGMVGYGYTRYYKRMVLQKMEHAFEPGDPVLELAEKGRLDATKHADQDNDHSHWIEREQQTLLDDIVAGRITGQYHLLIGEKGTGKSSMLIDAMAKIDGEGVAMFEAHADPEIFRVRLGKALDFEYHEDNIGALFSIRGPRDASALLDIERAFNKMEKVALRRRMTVGRPLILIINSAHLIRDDGDGRNLIELIQQRAEEWAASNLVTVIMNSDEYWPQERLKGYASRMNIVPFYDLDKESSINALRRYRMKYFGECPNPAELAHVYERVGGRLAFLNRVAKSKDMVKTCADICEMEKTWFLNKCWILGEEMDDDVMDQQKYASAAMVLAKALVEKEKADQLLRSQAGDSHTTTNNSNDDEKTTTGCITLPEFSLHEARYIMTRADFIQSYDQENLFTIDSKARVRADSVPMMNAFRDICSTAGFDERLEATLERISAIESLGRTRELTLKDLWDKGSYSIKVRDPNGVETQVVEVAVTPKDDGDEDAAAAAAAADAGKVER